MRESKVSIPDAAAPASPAAGSADSAPFSEGLHRQLSKRQLTMIAIGGAIGVGLFLGSSVTIQLAGPGVIISYLLGAVITVVVAYALAEMAVVHPVAGSFGVYAERYLSPWAGFSVRATYGLIQIIAIGAEVTAVAIYMAFWLPAVPGCSNTARIGQVCLSRLKMQVLSHKAFSRFVRFPAITLVRLYCRATLYLPYES